MEPQALPGERVEVIDNDGHRSLVSKTRLKTGDSILTVLGDDVSLPSRYSIQVGAREHVEPSVPPANLSSYDNYLWPFLNHGFSPNSMMVGRQLVATSDIEPGAEITFNYNANEWDMATPFRCHETGRMVAGNKNLSDEERAEIAEVTSEFILELARDEVIGRQKAAARAAS